MFLISYPPLCLMVNAIGGLIMTVSIYLAFPYHISLEIWSIFLSYFQGHVHSNVQSPCLDVSIHTHSIKTITQIIQSILEPNNQMCH